MSDKKAKPKIEIVGQDQPSYMVNEFHIFHNPNEFVLSVLEVIPQISYQTIDGVTPTGQRKNVTRLQSSGIVQRVVGRFGMSPAAFKKMVIAVQKNLSQFEKKYGEIAINPPEGMQ